MTKKSTAKSSKAAAPSSETAKKASKEKSAKTPKEGRGAKSKTTTAAAPIELRYTLAELPSSQHRAGLAGLVLMVRWLPMQTTVRFRGICEFVDLDDKGLTLRIDPEGLESLLDVTYWAATELQAESKVRKDKKGNEIEPHSTGVQETLDAKGKPKSKTVYFYPVTIPDGAFLTAWDKTHTAAKPGLWVKLWREMVWSILRGVPAQRRPFDLRAAGEATTDAAETWADLQRGDRSVDLPSTYYLGAQAATAEGVPFKDRARYQFLLHFWPFVAQVYVPQVLNNEGKPEHVGYAIAVPDVNDLENFSDEIEYVWRNRSAEDNFVVGYRPRGALIDLSIQGGLDFFYLLTRRIQRREGEKATGDLVLGVDVFHMQKDVNNVRIRGVGRVDPDEGVLDEFGRVRGMLWSPLFHRQWIANLLASPRLDWFHGFDRVFAVSPWKQTIDNDHFTHDARLAFKEFAQMTEASDKEANRIEAIIYRLVGAYLGGKIERKYGVRYGKEMKDEELAKYREYREKIARDAFLAIRSRTGVDFVDYFTGTLCSVPQHMKEADFDELSRSLLDVKQRDTVRTLTLLALSARG